MDEGVTPPPPPPPEGEHPWQPVPPPPAPPAWQPPPAQPGAGPMPPRDPQPYAGAPYGPPSGYGYAAAPTYEPGRGAMSVLPPQLAGWSWGGFFWNWIWAFFNGVTWAGVAGLLLTLFFGPGNLVLAIVLGAKGNEWAWQNKVWRDPEHFRSVQRKWALWGLVALLFWIALIVLFVIVVIAITAGSSTTSGTSF